jgi:hypothetical protein
MHTTLEQILHFEHPQVVQRFQKEYPQKAARAEVIFKDLLRFFWGTKYHEVQRSIAPTNSDLDFVFIMDQEMREIDQMWHIFLLYTRDYASFCQRYFSEFLHHQPDLVPVFTQNSFEFESNLQRFLTYTYDLFGEAVLRRWFPESLTVDSLSPH